MPKAATVSSQKVGFSAANMFAELGLGPPRILTGAVKSSDTDPTAIFVSKAMNCSDWIEISESMVSRYEYIGRVSCGDHDHPIVKLYLKAPETDLEKAYLMADTTTFQPLMPHSATFAAASLTPLRGGWYSEKGPCVTDIYGRRVYLDGTPCP